MAPSNAGSQRSEEEVPAAVQSAQPRDAAYVLTLEEIANLAAEGGKQNQSGPRSFVGPMDHSYRAVNGNFADTPPSTVLHDMVSPQDRSRLTKLAVSRAGATVSLCELKNCTN